jgi:hypothetical protein
MKTEIAKGPECEAESLYRTPTNANGSHGPALLGGLGEFMRFAKFNLVACAECGLTLFYADNESRSKLPKAGQWVWI